MRELLRLLFVDKDPVLGINRRNLDFVRTRNRRADFPLADDKLRTKQALAAAGIPTPETLTTFAGFHELATVAERLVPHDSFVIKPSQGHGGMGVMVVAGRDGDHLRTAGGRLVAPDQLRRHVADIIFGVFTLDKPDVAMVEPRLIPHPFFAALYPDGLSDLRLIMVDEVPVLSMIRVPTRASDGRANLHQGGLGLGVDLEDGTIYRAWHFGHTVETHPDTGERVLGRQVPAWERILEIAGATARALPLKYLGLDIVVDRDRGPMILEVNVRPGLEIQNVTGVPLMERFRRLGVAR